MAGKRLIGGGRGIDELIELNAEMAFLPNEGGGGVVGALQILGGWDGGRKEGGEECHTVKKTKESGRDEAGRATEQRAE